MKAVQDAQRARSERWHWPVDVTQYNCSPGLSGAEWQHLEKFIASRQQGKRFPSFAGCKDLQRLLRPIGDILTMTRATRQTRSAVISELLQEMHRRKASFWAWAEADWITFLGEQPDAFYQQAKPSLPRTTRTHLMAIGYLLGSLTELHRFGRFDQPAFASKVFGADRVITAIRQVCDTLLSWGYSKHRMRYHIPIVVCEVLLANRSPSLEDLTLETLDAVRRSNHLPYLRKDFVPLSRALVGLGILPTPLPPFTKDAPAASDPAAEGIPEVWLEWCQRWHRTTTLAPHTREKTYSIARRVGRWLAQEHPGIQAPGD